VTDDHHQSSLISRFTPFSLLSVPIAQVIQELSLTVAIDLSPSIDQQGVFSISVYSTAPTADSPDSREKFRLSLPSNELMPAETKAQTATVAAAAVATNDTNGKGEGLHFIDPRKIEAKLWQILPDECTGKPSERPDKHAGSYGGGGASGGYDSTGSGRGDERQRLTWTGTGRIDPRKKKAKPSQIFSDDGTRKPDEHVDYYDGSGAGDGYDSVGGGGGGGESAVEPTIVA